MMMSKSRNFRYRMFWAGKLTPIYIILTKITITSSSIMKDCMWHKLRSQMVLLWLQRWLCFERWSTTKLSIAKISKRSFSSATPFRLRVTLRDAPQSKRSTTKLSIAKISKRSFNSATPFRLRVALRDAPQSKRGITLSLKISSDVVWCLVSRIPDRCR